MKKNYIKPNAFVVEIKQKRSLLNASPNGYDGQKVRLFKQQQSEQEEDVISTEGDIF